MADQHFGASAAQASATTNDAFPVPSRAAFPRATATAAGETSEPRTNAPRALMCERERDGTGAGADIRDRRGVVRGDDVEDGLDEPFGFGARDEGVGSDDELQRPEFAAAGEIGDRLAGAPPFNQHRKTLHRVRGETLPRVRPNPGTAPSEHVREQDVRVEPRRFAPGPQ